MRELEDYQKAFDCISRADLTTLPPEELAVVHIVLSRGFLWLGRLEQGIRAVEAQRAAARAPRNIASLTRSVVGGALWLGVASARKLGKALT